METFLFGLGLPLVIWLFNGIESSLKEIAKNTKRIASLDTPDVTYSSYSNQPEEKLTRKELIYLLSLMWSNCSRGDLYSKIERIVNNLK